jgi:hypothetical protein
MAGRTLSNPSVEVNGETIGIVPNSLSYKDGRGNRTVRPESAGGNSINVVVTEDAETKKGMVKFSLYNTKVNDELKVSWQSTVDGNTVRFSDGDFVKPFRQMFVTEDPEVALGADGNMEIVFEGAPLI